MGKNKITKELEKKIGDEIEEGSIIYEMVAATLLCNSLDMMLRDVDNRIRAIYRRHGLNAKPAASDNVITGMSRYSKAVHSALYWFERDIEPRIEACTFESSGLKAYEDFRLSANELCRFILLMVDRGKIDGAMEKIFKFMENLEKGDRFTDDDLDRFIMK